MRTAAKTLVLLGTIATTAATARAEIGALDVVPAATLLVPYFEVEVTGKGSGTNTILTFGTVTRESTMTRVTLWTDLGVPTYAFDVYLTGYDQVTLDLRLLFVAGLTELTASGGQDPTDRISPQGPLSQDINFALCNDKLPLPAQLPVATREALVAAHRGKPSSLLGGKCGGASLGDNVVRGYLTIDTTNGCSSTLFPTSPGYFNASGDAFATNRNILTGTLEYREPFQNFAQGEPMIHLEASSTSPLTTGAARTFYRRAGGNANDGREPLPSQWQARFAARPNSAASAGNPWQGTSLIVFRQLFTPPAAFTCGPTPAPFPLASGGSVYSDDGVTMALAKNGFPRAAAKVRLGTELAVPSETGTLALDLKVADKSEQAAVIVVHDAEGRFSTATLAFPVGGTP